MMSTDYAPPDISTLREYLDLTGWSLISIDVASEVWQRETEQVDVPDDQDDDLVRGAVERVARLEGRPADQVANAVRHLYYDVTHLKAAKDDRTTDAIPLATAVAIIASARTMLRAAATTARRLRGHIGTFSRFGDDVVRETLMGHTEKGTFTIPVLVPLPRHPSDANHQAPIDGLELSRVPAEPFERRVMRTFAQSMQAVRNLVVEPARELTGDQVHELVYCGVSREFCLALAGILEQAEVSEFSATIDWAPALPVPATMPRDISIGADAVTLVRRAAERLRQQRVEPSSVFTGTIVELRHMISDPFGEIAVSTVRGGRPSEVRVRLPFAIYTDTLDWHRAGTAVLIEGKVRRSPGQPLTVDAPTRCHPVDEMYLPAAVS